MNDSNKKGAEAPKETTVDTSSPVSILNLPDRLKLLPAFSVDGIAVTPYSEATRNFHPAAAGYVL